MTEFDDAFFDKSQARITALRARLSEPALQGLAREVVDRLAARGAVAAAYDPAHPADEDIAILCAALVQSEPQRARGMMRRLQLQGLTLDVLYGRYLAPAAARLGKMWDESRLTFVEVSNGVARIFELIRMLRDQLPPPRITRAEPVLFASVPGDRHGVGVEMAAELFRQHGWDVQLMIGATHDAIMSEIGKVSCLVLGLSSGGHATAEALARLVHAVRVEHPEIFILVSGRIVVEEPDLVALMAPDGAVATVEDALATMDRLSDGTLHKS